MLFDYIVRYFGKLITKDRTYNNGLKMLLVGLERGKCVMLGIRGILFDLDVLVVSLYIFYTCIEDPFKGRGTCVC